MAAARRVLVGRVYDEPAEDAGRRVLVDRVWPRGLRKDGAPWDEWAKDVAPSTELRRWYGHDPTRFAEFGRRYSAELDTPTGRAATTALLRGVGNQPLTLLTATKDVEHSHAMVLAKLLTELPAVD